MAAQKAKVVDVIRGKNLVSGARKEDVSLLLDHIDALESLLDEADGDDVFGTEGWRHHLDID